MLKPSKVQLSLLMNEIITLFDFYLQIRTVKSLAVRLFISPRVKF